MVLLKTLFHVYVYTVNKLKRNFRLCNFRRGTIIWIVLASVSHFISIFLLASLVSTALGESLLFTIKCFGGHLYYHKVVLGGHLYYHKVLWGSLVLPQSGFGGSLVLP